MRVAATTVRRVLARAGIDPASQRFGLRWRDFLRAQGAHILAADFLIVDTLFFRQLLDGRRSRLFWADTPEARKKRRQRHGEGTLMCIGRGDRTRTTTTDLNVPVLPPGIRLVGADHGQRRSGPKGRDRRSQDAVAHSECPGTRMEQNPGNETVGEAIPQGTQVAHIVTGRGRGGFDLDGDHRAASELAEDVDLEPAVLLAHVIEARA